MLNGVVAGNPTFMARKLKFYMLNNAYPLKIMSAQACSPDHYWKPAINYGDQQGMAPVYSAVRVMNVFATTSYTGWAEEEAVIGYPSAHRKWQQRT